jgi:tetratricopeptide (TPR) repeat protein
VSTNPATVSNASPPPPEASTTAPARLLQQLDEALRKQPKDLRLLSRRADALIDLNRLDEARKTVRHAMDIAGKTADAVLLGQASRLALLFNRHDEAIKLAMMGLGKAPAWAEFHGVLGVALRAKGKAGEAIDALERAVNLNPLKRSYRIALGQALEAAGQLDRAERVYRHGAVTDPGFGDAFLNLANVQQSAGSYDEAASNYDQSLRLLGQRAHIYGNYGALERKRLRYPAAHKAYRKSQVLKPNDPGTLYNLGNLLRAEDRLDEAIRIYKHALLGKADSAGVHWNLSLALLAAGYLGEGFREYEWRWQYENFPSKRRDFKQPLWDGSPLNGRTLLLHTEQGVGDVLQFLRFLPAIIDRKGGDKPGRIVFEIHDTIVSLIGNVPGVDQTIERFENPPHFDVHLPLLSAPLILGVETLDDLPVEVPYLQIPDGPDFPIPEADPERLKVGFVWGGNPQFQQDRERSTDIDHYLPLFDMPGIQWFCLQKGDREPEHVKAPDSVVRVNERIKDFRDTAVIMTKLDLVITTCTSVAHLAGALGVPTLVLVSRNPDWRWMVGRSDSPWYPSVQVLRQKTHGDWPGVFADVRTELETRVRDLP